MRVNTLVTSVFIVVFSASSLLAQDLRVTSPSTDLPASSSCPSGCVEAEDNSRPSDWYKSFGLGFSYTDGNANTSDLNILGALNRDYQKNILDFSFAYSYGESDQSESGDPSNERNTIKNQALANASYKRLLADRWFVGAGSSFKYDEIADIDYRVNAGVFAGVFLVREDELSLSLEAGPSHVFEQVGGIYDQYFSPRVANSFEWKLSPTARIFQKAELLWDVSDSDNYIVNGELGVESALTSLLSIILLFRDAYDNQPAAGLVRNDLAFITSLNANF